MPPEKAPAHGVFGQITRGTTNTNRLRRIDRWIARHPVLRRTADPFVVDLGYGASAVTVLELERRLSVARPDVEVLGLEIDPARNTAGEQNVGAAGARGAVLVIATDEEHMIARHTLEVVRQVNGDAAQAR